MKRLFFLVAVATLLAGEALSAAPQPVPAPGPHGTNFGGLEDVIELKDKLGPYQLPQHSAADNSVWYMLTAANTSQRPAIRVLQAGQPASESLSFFPRPKRPAILQVAPSDAAVLVERANAYGHGTFRVTIPPLSSVALAIQIADAQTPPSLLAWSEAALAAHDRQLAIFIAGVAGLIAAAAAITAGLAVIKHHVPPRWAAIMLLFILLERLAGTGMFDASLATAVGGPYGLMTLFAGFALAAGAYLADSIVPIVEVWPWARRWFRWGVVGLMALSVLAYMGVPGMADVTGAAIVLGSAAITAYLVQRGRMGSQAARVTAPSAAVFALVVFASAVAMLTSLGGGLAPDVPGGFAALGAVLLALAIAAGEGIYLLPHRMHAVAGHGAAAKVEHPPQALAALHAIGASRQGVFDLDLAHDTVMISSEAAVLIGLPEAPIRIEHALWIARIHRDDREVYEQALTDYRAQSGLAFRIEFRVRDEAGNYPWLELRATILGDGVPANRCLGLVADVTTRKQSEAALIDRTLRDPLTGLGNRVALMEDLEQLGDGFKDAVFALLDIDRFKSIHASLGDAGGDDILAKIAERLVARFSDVGEVFRVGGDAFAVLFAATQEDPAAIGDELIATCGAPLLQNGREVFAPASVGITVGGEAKDPLDLLKNAELAMLQAKRRGGGCVHVYSSDLDAAAPGDAVALEAELRRALELNQLTLFYQPIIRLADSTVAGFEALLRWRHPEKGLIAPADFIAHSEATGLIVALGQFALKRAADDLVSWQKFFPLSPPLFASVNVSRRQLREADFEVFLGGLLGKSGIAPGTLRLEVTESAVATDGDVRAALVRVRLLGAALAIDDFGTGLSSLSQLKDVPFDVVKIDRSFLARQDGVDAQEGEDVVLTSIVSLAHDLKCQVVVEGVENEADASRVLALGCEFAQGFYFSEALSASDTLNFIARHYDAHAAAVSGASGLRG